MGTGTVCTSTAAPPVTPIVIPHAIPSARRNPGVALPATRRSDTSPDDHRNRATEQCRENHEIAGLALETGDAVPAHAGVGDEARREQTEDAGLDRDDDRGGPARRAGHWNVRSGRGAGVYSCAIPVPAIV